MKDYALFKDKKPCKWKEKWKIAEGLVDEDVEYQAVPWGLRTYYLIVRMSRGFDLNEVKRNPWMRRIYEVGRKTYFKHNGREGETKLFLIQKIMDYNLLLYEHFTDSRIHKPRNFFTMREELGRQLNQLITAYRKKG